MLKHNTTRLQMAFVTVVFMITWATLSIQKGTMAPLQWEHLGILAVSLGLKGWDKWVTMKTKETPQPNRPEPSKLDGGSNETPPANS